MKKGTGNSSVGNPEGKVEVFHATPGAVARETLSAIRSWGNPKTIVLPHHRSDSSASSTATFFKGNKHKLYEKDSTFYLSV
ncbi:MULTISPECIES: hypothetical protein [Nostocales]|uniref:Uncharacterized protein n=3 Tax=Nostocales TaxID=1161 RepID=A0A0C1RGN6_9CYAN|nr:hypothetical protein [Tolypothrix bouteillei]KAF3887336.1 hypothetical protein DA73_0400018950 [Tolypothrix bouteillei VB521301]